MDRILLVIHLLLAISLVGVILVQRSEGGGLGIGGSGGGGGGMGGFLSGRSTANLLTRTTSILAALFFATSIALAIISTPGESGSVIDAPGVEDEVPALPDDADPAVPVAPRAAD